MGTASTQIVPVALRGRIHGVAQFDAARFISVREQNTAGNEHRANQHECQFDQDHRLPKTHGNKYRQRFEASSAETLTPTSYFLMEPAARAWLQARVQPV